ncbi:MAG: hypothetical protein MHM6MM_000911 [Cercozoa sp. M6MM]
MAHRSVSSKARRRKQLFFLRILDRLEEMKADPVAFEQRMTFLANERRKQQQLDDEEEKEESDVESEDKNESVDEQEAEVDEEPLVPVQKLSVDKRRITLLVTLFVLVCVFLAVDSIFAAYYADAEITWFLVRLEEPHQQAEVGVLVGAFVIAVMAGQAQWRLFQRSDGLLKRSVLVAAAVSLLLAAGTGGLLYWATESRIVMCACFTMPLCFMSFALGFHRYRAADYVWFEVFTVSLGLRAFGRALKTPCLRFGDCRKWIRRRIRKRVAPNEENEFDPTTVRDEEALLTDRDSEVLGALTVSLASLCTFAGASNSWLGVSIALALLCLVCTALPMNEWFQTFAVDASVKVSLALAVLSLAGLSVIVALPGGLSLWSLLVPSSYVFAAGAFFFVWKKYDDGNLRSLFAFEPEALRLCWSTRRRRTVTLSALALVLVAGVVALLASKQYFGAFSLVCAALFSAFSALALQQFLSLKSLGEALASRKIAQRLDAFIQNALAKVGQGEVENKRVTSSPLEDDTCASTTAECENSSSSVRADTGVWVCVVQPNADNSSIDFASAKLAHKVNYDVRMPMFDAVGPVLNVGTLESYSVALSSPGFRVQ